MNTGLKEIFDRSIEVFQNDPRILGAWHFGSIAKKGDDDYSDVDPVFLVKKEKFNEVDKELTDIFNKICSKIHLCLAEGFNDNTIKNYAILLESNDIYQYDFTIVKEGSLGSGMANVFFSGCKKENIIFDKNNVVENSIIQFNSQQIVGKTKIDHSYVKSEIEKYWLFVFISMKYFMREDVFKVIYARDEMRGVHLNILRMAINKGDWSWWPESINKNLDKAKKDDMLSYFGAPIISTMKDDFRKQIAAFSKDAKLFCTANGIEYLNNLEVSILGYVNKHFKNTTF